MWQHRFVFIISFFYGDVYESFGSINKCLTGNWRKINDDLFEKHRKNSIHLIYEFAFFMLTFSPQTLITWHFVYDIIHIFIIC